MREPSTSLAVARLAGRPERAVRAAEDARHHVVRRVGPAGAPGQAQGARQADERRTPPLVVPAEAPPGGRASPSLELCQVLRTAAAGGRSATRHVVDAEARTHEVAHLESTKTTTSWPDGPTQPPPQQYSSMNFLGPIVSGRVFQSVTVGCLHHATKA